MLAPTGTISFLMDCDTTGIEPDIALVKYKQLAGGGMLKIVNQTVPLALKTLGYDQPQIESILAYIDKRRHDRRRGRPEARASAACSTAPSSRASGTRSIAWQAHVRMMAAAQPFLSGAISQDGEHAARHHAGRHRQRLSGRLAAGPEGPGRSIATARRKASRCRPAPKPTRPPPSSCAVPRRERLPDTRKSITHKFNVAGHEGYITVGLYDDGRPGELFITMAKEGSTIGGLMDCFGTAVSMSLQYGVPLEVYVNKFSHTRFEPMGHTKNPDIRIAKSIVDYIFRWLGITFLPGYREANKGMLGRGRRRQARRSGRCRLGESRSPPPRRPAGQARGQDRPPRVDAVESPRRSRQPTARTQRSRQEVDAAEANAALLHRAGVAMHIDLNGGVVARAEQFASFQTDAPSCDNCGAITVRNGNCYLCHNCGNSMGCS